MTATQFWDEDPWLAAAYRKANALRGQRKSEEMWLQGLYNHIAFSTVVRNALSKKGTRPARYLEEPIRLIPLTEAEKEAKAEKEREKTIAFFNQLAKKWGNNVL